MDKPIKLTEENPKFSANIFTKLFFGWIFNFFYEHRSDNKITLKSIYKLLDDCKSKHVTNSLEENWKKELQNAKNKNKKPSLIKCFIKTFFLQFVISGIMAFVDYILLRPFQPIMLAYFVFNFTIKEDFIQTNIIIMGSFIVIFAFLTTVLYNHKAFREGVIGMKMRIGATSLVYKKLLVLNENSISTTSAGDVLNLLSNDLSRFDNVLIFLHYVWICPLQLLILTCLCWYEVGISSLSGIAVIVIFAVLLQGIIGRYTGHMRKKTAEFSDKRVGLLEEIFSSILVIKMYVWEKPFQRMIAAIRQNELYFVRLSGFLKSFHFTAALYVERAAVFLTVLLYFLLNHSISSEKSFLLFQLFNTFQLSAIVLLPCSILWCSEALVAMRRLEAFLLLEEKDNSMVKDSSGDIRLENVTFGWSDSISEPLLNKINLNIPKNKLCIIVGQVGSGKSTLLKLLLGELNQQEGKLASTNNISYSNQEPWIFSSTIRENILCGKSYNKEWYYEVIKNCSLLQDFSQLSNGDDTLVGENGATLSGGQRARINMARCVYNKADVYLFDDPLSAVDSRVGNCILKECILNLLGDKTRILITHHTQYLKYADVIVVINNGSIEVSDSYDEIMKTSETLRLLSKHADNGEEDDTDVLRKKQSVTREISKVENKPELDKKEEAMPKVSAFKGYIMETRSCFIVFMVFFLFILTQVLYSGTDYLLGYWTDQESHHEILKVFVGSNKTINLNETYYKYIPENSEENILNETGLFIKMKIGDYYHSRNNNILDWFKENLALTIYLFVVVSLIIIGTIRSFILIIATTKISKHLHENMLEKVMNASMYFFHCNSSGRILNRFSKDLGTVDEMFPKLLLSSFQCLLVVAGLLIMLIVTNYYTCIFVIIVTSSFWYLNYFFTKTVKNLRHLEGSVKSPIFNYVKSSFSGLLTIRALKVENILMKQFDELQDCHSAVWYTVLTSSSFISLVLDMISVVLLFIVIFGFIILKNFMEINASMVGLGVCQAMILVGLLQYALKEVIDALTNLASVERTLQYTTIKVEDKNSYKTIELKSNWPENGKIEFINVCLRYSPEKPLVLQNFNLNINPGEKIGIVGRTGAGKSSLLSALFRLATFEGIIKIDGEDITSIDIQQVRKSMSIIPQEPVLFSASVRFNLDPFEEFTDDKLWQVLEEVQMKEAISSLDYKVQRGGSNFSVGQRQLICLARTILRNNRIIILDEATANVDLSTDEMIQTTISKKFANSTVLVIAHRLITIMDSDKILVVDKGRNVEFDHPHLLLQNKESFLSKMVLETGRNMTDTLHKIAEAAFNRIPK